MSESSEKLFYENGAIRVTSSRLIIANVTYALANIASVSTSVKHPSRFWPIVFILGGVMWGMVDFMTSQVPYFALGAIVVGILILSGQKTEYGIRVSSSSGESTPLESKNRALIEGIVTAVNDAIVHRG